MADPLSLVVSIAGLAGFGLQLVQVLNAYAGSATDAKGRIQAISNDIDVTVQVLAIFKDNLQDERNRQCMSREAELVARDAVRMCDDIFKEIDRLLQGSIKKASGSAKPDSATSASKIGIPVSLLQRLKWPFIEPKLDLLRGNLEKVKATLQLLMNVVIFAVMSKMQASQPQIDEQIAEIERLRLQKAEADLQLTALLDRHPDLKGEGMVIGSDLDLAEVQSPIAMQSGSECRTEEIHCLSTDSENLQPFPTLNNFHVLDSAPEGLSHMKTLRADYVACIQQLNALQLTLETALDQLFVSTGSGAETNTNLDSRTRLEIHQAVRKSAQETEQYLRSRIANSPVVTAMSREVSLDKERHVLKERVNRRKAVDTISPPGLLGRSRRKKGKKPSDNSDWNSYQPEDDRSERGRVFDTTLPQRRYTLEFADAQPGTSNDDPDADHIDANDDDDNDNGSGEILDLSAESLNDSENHNQTAQEVSESWDVEVHASTRNPELYERLGTRIYTRIEPNLPTLEDLLRRWTTLYDETSTSHGSHREHEF